MTTAWLEKPHGERVPISGTCSLGRGSTNTVALTDEKASRRHALIHAQGQDEFWLSDLGSRNGTYLNGRRVSQPVQLSDNDRITLGNTDFAFRHPRPATSGGRSAGNQEKTLQEIKTANCWLLLADIESSTQFVRRSAQNELAVLTGDWLAAYKAIIEEHGGTLNKYLGDGFLAYWLHRDGIDGAVAQALKALELLQAREQPRFRVVVHFGPVVMGGSASLGEESLMGTEVNFVFRMEKLAASLGASRLMSDPARLGLQAHTATSAAGRHTLSGFDGEFDFYSC